MDPIRESYLIGTIPMWPMLTCVLLGLFGRKLSERWVTLIAVAGPLASFVNGAALFWGMNSGAGVGATCELYEWFSVGTLSVKVAFSWDSLSAAMVLVVSGVGSLIHVYSAGYMHHDKGFARFFTYLNLFTAMMLVLVLAENLPLMFVGWEGVGLCSYLLIGFWFEDSANAAAGMKAFLVNRVGDAAFLMGMFLAFQAFGSLSFSDLAAGNAPPGLTAEMATAITLLLFVGACGKSAQIPLYVWLPDAMAGPTPVSALIHAATMVTAGVYMIGRLSALFFFAPITGTIIAIVGACTAFFAATIALAQNDIKKVLAYSTISQLGYMFVAMGLGAYGAGMFHLVTHAFFKALLFLGAGAIIHALGGEQDMRRMGGLRHKLPLVYICFLVGAVALSGLPPLAGFWSKDLILENVLAHALDGHGSSWMVYCLCVGGAFLTAFYSFRMVAMTFFGEPADVTHEGGHDPSLGMSAVLLVLAALSILGGLLNLPAFAGSSGQLMTHFLSFAEQQHSSHPVLANLAVTLPLVLCGVLLGFGAYTSGRAAWRAMFQKGVLATLTVGSRAAWYVDEMLAAASRWVSLATAKVLLSVDQYGIDRFVNGLPHGFRMVGQELRRGQAGRLQGYLMLFGLGVVAIFAYLFGISALLPWVSSP